ncbi:erythromycin esterase family protein [Mycolicibacterium hodleri]|uniref:erythromycin esterase family protein n=1 Tax=Mycolicibacterium hodleri TaxID=49897 RepID=UPI0022A7687F|nr:erythromycin esterase family protein [Mycolicibacterium hodleri]
MRPKVTSWQYQRPFRFCGLSIRLRWSTDAAVQRWRLHRAIGVIYRPETERHSHYVHVRPAEEYDAMVHLDVTTALKPLEPNSIQSGGETPETYPTGL